MVSSPRRRRPAGTALLTSLVLMGSLLVLMVPGPLNPTQMVAAEEVPEYTDASDGLPTTSLWVAQPQFFDLDEDGMGDLTILGPRKGPGDKSLHVMSWNGNTWTDISNTLGTNNIPHSSYGGHDFGDIDNDADWDVGVGSHGAQRLDSYTQLATGGWVRSSNGLASSEDAWSVDLGDFNSDGNLDIAEGGFWERDLHVYAGDGAGNWIESSNGLHTARAKHESHFCDVNSDGHLDLVVGMGDASGADEVIFVYRGDGQGNWVNSSQGLPQSGIDVPITCGDIDNDGVVDLALTDSSFGTRAYLGDGRGNWTDSSEGLPEDEYYASVVLGDMNNDGFDDLVALKASDPGVVHLYLANGAGQWTLADTTTMEGNAKGWRVGVGDFDHNGYRDIVAGFGTEEEIGSIRVWQETTEPTELGVEVTFPDGREYLQPGSVQFIRWMSAIPDGTSDRLVKLQLSTNGPEGPFTTFAADLPDSGIYQWTVPDQRTGNAYLRVYVDDDQSNSVNDISDRAFGIGMPAGSAPDLATTLFPYAEPAWTGELNESAYAVAWEDVDKDGDDDLAVGILDGSIYLYHSTDGRLELEAAWQSIEEDPTEDLAWGDIDDNGWPDLVAASGAWGAGIDRVYLNNEGSLSETADWSSSQDVHSNSVALGDYDNDDDLDLAVGVYNGYNLIHRNDDGTLTEDPVWYSANAHGTLAVAWADVDEDDDLDLIAGNSGTTDNTDWNRNNIYENQGPTFSYLPTTTPTWYSDDEYWTTDLHVADVDRDGDMDLVAANGYGNDHILVLYNNDFVESSGDDHLNPAYVWEVQGGAPYEIDMGDINDDNFIDLAVGHYEYPAQIFLNYGGSFPSSSSWNGTHNYGTQSIALGDMEGDGRLDIAEGNRPLASTPGHEKVYSSNLPPVMVVLEPANNAVVQGDLNIKGTVYDREGDEIDRAEIAIDGGLWEEMDLTEAPEGGYTWQRSWNTELATEGEHSISVRAASPILSSQELKMTVTVRNLNYAPLLYLDSPTPGSQLLGTVTLKGRFLDFNDDGVTVEVSVNNGSFKTAQMDQTKRTWEYQWDTSVLDPGTHSVTLRASDGFDTSREQMVLYQVLELNRPPVGHLLSPGHGDIVDPQTTITWLCQDPNGDELEVALYYRHSSTQQPTLLKDGLGEDGELIWDTSSLPGGFYFLGLRTDDGELVDWDNATLQVYHPAPAEFHLLSDSLTINPTDPREGKNVMVWVEVENTGDVAGRVVVEFFLDNEPQPFFDVEQEIDAKDDKLFMGHWKALVGEHTLTVRLVGQPNEVQTLQVEVEAVATDGGGNDEDELPIWTLVLGALVVLVAVGGVAVWYQQREEEEADEVEGSVLESTIPVAGQYPVAEPMVPPDDEDEIDWG